MAKQFKDMRGFLEEVEKIGELKIIEGADWNGEIGLLRFSARKGECDCPVVLFDNIKDYPEGYRVVCGAPNSPRRLAMILGIGHDSNEETTWLSLIKKIKEKIKGLKTIPPKEVKDGPVMENVYKGDDIDLFKFPTPLWHPGDGGRYIGTMDSIITRDPEEDWVNMGTYRTMIRDKSSLLTYIDPGKHCNIQRQKWFDQEKDMPVVLCFGADPLFPVVSGMEFPWGAPEFDTVGGFRGEPVEVIRGEITGLPFPANAEIVVEGFVSHTKKEIEGPFAEFTGYYGSGARPEPVIEVKALYHRDNPIIHGLLTNGRPPRDKVGRRIDFRSFMRSALIWQQLETVGIPDVKGVYCHPAGGSQMWIVTSITQRYVGHAKQAATIASQCHPGAQLGRYSIVVDEEVDPTYDYDVIWAISTRSEPAESIDILRRCWSGPLDPKVPVELKTFGYNSRGIIDACVPYEQRVKFAGRATFTEELRSKIKAKFGSTIYE